METRGLCEFWEEASVLHQQLRRHYATNDPGLSERLVSQPEEAIVVRIAGTVREGVRAHTCTYLELVGSPEGIGR